MPFPAQALLPRKQSLGARQLQLTRPTLGVGRQLPPALRITGRHSVKIPPHLSLMLVAEWMKDSKSELLAFSHLAEVGANLVNGSGLSRLL